MEYRASRMKELRLPAGRGSGNVLIWIVVVMLIFAVLGAAMVSLFTTSVTSSAVQNDSRRAVLLHESGVRYARSALWAGDFSKATVSALNDADRVYTLTGSGAFTLNVASPWFDALGGIDIASGDASETLKLGEGRLIPGMAGLFPAAAPFLTLVNYDYIDFSAKPNPPPSARARITGAAAVPGEPARIRLDLSDDGDADGFVANKDERLCIAVRPTEDQDIAAFPGSLNVDPAAARVFPRHGGAFEINRQNFYYERAVDRGTHVELAGIRPVATGGAPPESIAARTTDYVILTPRNRLIAAEGRSGGVAFGGHVDQAAAIADTSIAAPGSRKADIDFAQEDLGEVLGVRSSRSELISLRNDPGEKEIVLGAGPGPSFGAVWFRDTRSIGGQRNFCSTGECLFGRGVRAFFTVKLSSAPTSNFEGEGFVFTISNGAENSVGSVGGDIEQAELLGYSGDSRTTSPEPPATPTFLDGAGRGLVPPKIGLEFDTRVNYDADFEKTQNFCSGGGLRADTRNDPLADDKHAVQYVFWGKEALNLACRTTTGRASYDDNRHDAVGFGSGNWAKALFGNTNSGPAVAADGAILVGSADNKLFAVNADGTERWRFTAPAGEVYSPTLTASRAYVGSEDGKLYAVSLTSGSKIWEVNRAFPVRSKPAVDGDGKVYVSAGNSLAKVDPGSGTTTNVFNLAFDATSSPALSRDRLTVYTAFADNKLYARKTSDLSARWASAAVGRIQGEMAVGADEFIYAGAANGLLKIAPADGSIAAGPFFPGAGVTGSPALSRDGRTVYAGFGNGRLYALDSATLAVKWSFPSTGVIGSVVGPPVVDDNENVYVGSDNGYIYALFADGTVKWEFNTGGRVRARPAVDRNGVVYAGSDGSGGQLWAVNQFAEPRNYRENLQNVPPDSQWARNLVAFSAPNAVDPYFSSIASPNKWLRDGTWAVRFEIDRTPLSDGRAQFDLRAWVQQCTDASCTNIRGTFFEDTRVSYAFAAKPPNLVQSFQLDSTRNAKFNTFLFGFSTAKSASDDQVVTIGSFKLSFNRPGDPRVNLE